MPGRYQQILQRLRLLALCLIVAVAFEPPVGRVESSAPAVAVASWVGAASRVTSQVRRSTSEPASRVKRLLSSRVEALHHALSHAPSPFVGRESPFDGRHLYLAYRVLLC